MPKVGMDSGKIAAFAVGAVTAVLLLATRAAFAFDDGVTIHACVDNKQRLRIVPRADQCRSREVLLEWNIIGLQGPEGPPGLIANDSCSDGLFVTGVLNGELVCESPPGGPVPTAEICNNNDDDLNGQVDDGLGQYCLTGGIPAANTNGDDACLAEYFDTDSLPGNGCEDFLPLLTWYRDADGDGLGDPNNTLLSQTQPAGYVDNSDDCDDTDASNASC